MQYIALIYSEETEPTPEIMLAKRKMRSRELSEHIGITEQNISLLKSGKVKGIRFETLDRICKALDCQPGDLLEFRPDVSSSAAN